MYFESFQDLIAMGGHGIYVWLSYAIAVVVVMGLFVQPLLRKRSFIAQQRMILRRQQRQACQ